MSEFVVRKKEEKQLLDGEEKKKPMAPHAITMSEGPMALKESQKVEQMGRVSYEKSVKIELEGFKGKKGKKKGKKKKRVKKIKIR